MSMLMQVALRVAATPPADVDPTTGEGPEWGKAAPIGLLIILLLGIALFFLLRSMTKRIKNVPASFDSVTDEVSTVRPDVDQRTDTAPSAQPATTDPGGSGLVDERSG